jgi:hypothetical protein
MVKFRVDGSQRGFKGIKRMSAKGKGTSPFSSKRVSSFPSDRIGHKVAKSIAECSHGFASMVVRGVLRVSRKLRTCLHHWGPPITNFVHSPAKFSILDPLPQKFRKSRSPLHILTTLSGPIRMEMLVN